MFKTLTADDGHTLDCWIEPAQGARQGGLVILQEIFGVTDQLKGLAQTYAALGYEVAIPALFDRVEKGAVVPFDEAPRGRDLMMETELDNTVRDIDAAAQALSDSGGKVAVMGFCWGGGLAIRSAQKLQIAGAVAFYGTRLPQYLDAPLNAPLLAHFGRTDDHVPPEMLAEAQAALPEMEVHLYDAGHAFANDARPAAYNADAAAVAHQRTQAFLAKHLG
jgi:carboxymethylenebutenolidase